MEQDMLINFIRANAIIVLIIAAVLSIALGCAIGFFYNANDVASRTRDAVKDPTGNFLWYEFHAKPSWFISAQGMATDFWKYGDIQQHNINDVSFEMIAEAQFGLPFKSHSYTFVRYTDGAAKVLKNTGVNIGDRTVPLNINLSGWLANTAVLWMLLMAILVSYKQSVFNYRISQGLCLYCRYDVRDIVDKCPECGGHIISRATAPND